MLASKRPQFDPNRPLVARVPFTFHGFAFHPGDDFPGDRLAEVEIPERRVAAMYTSRHLDFRAEAAKAPTSEQRPAPAPKKPAKATDKAAASGGFVAFHKGFGRFQVLSPTGEVIAEDLTKPEAQAKAAELNSETRRGAGDAGAGEASSAVSSAPAPNPG